MASFDVIVIGVGSMGAATCYELAERGLRVLGLEQFRAPHEQGEHSGQSRIIRKAYFEHPDYVPLLERAYRNWKQLEQLTGTQVYYPVGLLYFGEPSNPLIRGSRLSASQFGIPLEDQTPANRHNAFQVPDSFSALLEPDAGLLTPERAIRLYINEAVRSKAVIHQEEKVLGWQSSAHGVLVTTDKNTYSADKLVITAGPWAGQLIPALRNELTVTRQVLAWMEVEDPERYRPEHFPCWTFAVPGMESIFYGFPLLDTEQFGGPAGLKLAWHAHGTATDPDHVNREVSEAEEALLVRFLQTYMPGAYKRTLTLKTCLYTNTPDEHFIIDHLPGNHNNVILAAGFSGHGFKFVSVVGEVLADLAEKGNTALPIDFLRIRQ